MRLSEKTLEINICSQMSALLKRKQNLFWFGLTQKQEAKAGFDVCTKFGGRLLIFQFKASNHVLKSGQRKLLVPHYQFKNLKRIAGSSVRSVFYAFPMVGNTLEMQKDPDLLHQTWLLDLTRVPQLSPPTSVHGLLRKNGCHNVYVLPRQAEIHSEPINVPLYNARELASSGFSGVDGFHTEGDNQFESFWEYAKTFTKGARGLVLFYG